MEEKNNLSDQQNVGDNNTSQTKDEDKNTTNDASKTTTTKDNEVDYEDFVRSIIQDIEKDEKEQLERLKSENDEKIKGVLKESFKTFNDQKKDLLEQMKKQQETIQQLQEKMDNISSGSKVKTPPGDNPFKEKKIDPDNDEQIEDLFFKKFNMSGI